MDGGPRRLRWWSGLQRGRRRSSPEGTAPAALPLLPGTLASTGPATFIAGRGDVTSNHVDLLGPLQRGRRRSSPEGRRRLSARRTSCSFNGAGDVHRRKARQVRARATTRGALASTGPATFIAGRERVEMRPGSAALLQRGRRRSSPEGPRPSMAGRFTSTLQRGRRRSSPEGPPASRSKRPRASLQRGRRRSSPEGRVACGGWVCNAGRASTGPATFIAGRA